MNIAYSIVVKRKSYLFPIRVFLPQRHEALFFIGMNWHRLQKQKLLNQL